MPSRFHAPARLALLATLTVGLGAQSRPTPAPWSGGDPTVRPQDDLYGAANGGWMKATPIPADRSEVFGADLPAVVTARLKALLASLVRHRPAPGTPEQKVVDHYRAYLDTAALDRAGLAPLRPLLQEIAGLDSVEALAAWQGRAQGRLQTPIWLWGGFADFMEPGLNRVMAWQGGLGLPDRTYYLDTKDPRIQQAREAYLTYLTRLATLVGDADPAGRARQVMALERRLAEAHVPLAEARDPSRMYNPLTAAEWEAKAPGFPWRAFLAAAGIPGDHKVTVTQLGTAITLARLYREVPLEDWKAYLTLRSVDEAAPVLPRAFREAHFAFHGTALSGTTTEKPRADKALNQVLEVLNEPLARLYVARHFPAPHRAEVRRIFEAVREAYREQLAHCTWMSPATRTAALGKLAKLRAKIGHPDTWAEDPSLLIRSGEALGNRHRAKRRLWERQAAMSNRPMDRSAWPMSPLEVNAFYDPQGNEITLTAAILQPPLFDMTADPASNFGGIGAQIGHEISHGFDNLGAQFDGEGVMRNWWGEADRKAFEALGARLVAQAAAFEALPGKPVDGGLTLPENMADLIGLQVAFRAYQASLGGKPAPVLQGLTGEQRFFLAYARSWRAKLREERTLQLLHTDPHAPHAFRANGPVTNLDGFHEAFGTRPGDGLFRAPGDRIHLW